MIPVLLSMDLGHIAIALIVVGILLWAANRYIPMDGKIRNILNIVVVVFVVLWLLKEFGLLDYMSDIKP
jgi:hypothetical protein